MFIHAARESSVGVPLSPGEYALALKVRDEEHLLEISRLLFSNGIKHKLIKETDPPYEGQAMAIGCAPCEREGLKRLLSSLPLVR